MSNAELILKLVEMLLESEKKKAGMTTDGQNGQSSD